MKIFSKEIPENIYYRESIKNILIEANTMLSGKYLFNNVWDMEPCDELVENFGFKWNIKYHNDFEWSYMFTRFDFSYKFIVAYEITGKIEYIYYGLKFINEWKLHNLKFIKTYIGKIYNKIARKKSFAHRSLDMAILSSNIADYILYCYEKKMINKSSLLRYKHLVLNIYNFIYNSDREFKTKTNWGPIEISNCLYAVNVLNIDVPYKEMLDRLENQLKFQILQDGSHIESSPMYLVEILLPILKCIYFCKNIDTNNLLYYVKKGCDYIKMICTPDYCIPNIGDSDSVNISDLMILASKIFNDINYLEYVNRNITIEYIYKYKVDPIDKVFLCKTWNQSENSRTELLHQVIIKDNNFGIYLLCNNIPYGPSGHKHYDYLSVLLYIHGKAILVDCGRETYVNSEIRRSSKSPVSHNTIAINGNTYWKTKDAWEADQYIQNNITKTIKGINGNNIHMSCILGKNEIRVTRIVTYVKSIGIIITDLINGDSFKEYEAFFNIDKEVQIDFKKDYYLIQLEDVSLFYNNTIMDNTQIIYGRCSKRYNIGFLNNRIYCKSKSNVSSHYFMFNKKNVITKIENGNIIYVNTDTQQIIECINDVL